jgi:hypothetical protein
LLATVSYGVQIRATQNGVEHGLFMFDLRISAATGACGKTSLLCSFALGEFPKEYVRYEIQAFVIFLTRFPFLTASK